MTNLADAETSYFVGIDLGGTTTKLAVIEGNDNPSVIASNCRDTFQFPTCSEEHVSKWFTATDVQLRELLSVQGVDYSHVKGGLLAVPAAATFERIMREMPNICSGSWRKTDLRAGLEAALEFPIRVCNDASAAAYGEFYAKGVGSLVYIGVGTGLGGGVIHGPKANITGYTGYLGEIGHIHLPESLDPFPGRYACGCGAKSCVERVVSLGGVQRLLDEKLKDRKYRKHPLAALKSQVRARKLLSYTWETQDSLGISVFRTQAKAVGYLCHTAVAWADPEEITIGGGWADGPVWFQETILERIRKTYRQYPYFKGRSVNVSFATLGDSSGAVGSALLARRFADSPPVDVPVTN